jgi:hypothetical protein
MCQNDNTATELKSLPNKHGNQQALPGSGRKDSNAVTALAPEVFPDGCVGL